jgi:group I intron endonuclease
MDNQEQGAVGHIYGIKNIVNGKWYVGQTRDIDDRKYRHFLHLKKKTHFNRHLQFSYNKYGEHCFEFVILEEVPVEMLDIREINWISYYKSNQDDYGYNNMSGGMAFSKHSEETKKKQKEAAFKRMKERPHTRPSGWKEGVKLSEKHKKKLSEAAKKRWKNKEEREKQSKRYKGKKQDPIFLAKRIDAIRLGYALKKQMRVSEKLIQNN